MKTELKSNPEKKDAMIKLIAEAIDKNTKDEHEVYLFIKALEDTNSFLSDQRWQLSENFLSITRYIEDDLKKSAWLKSFEEMSEIASGAMIVSNQCCEGIQIICDMSEEFKAVSECYGN